MPAAITLRPATLADEDLLARLLPDDFDHDPAFPRDEGTGLREHRQRWVRSWLRELVRQENAWPFAVVLRGESVGFQLVEVSEDERGERVAETSSFLVPEARGRGLGVEMRRLALDLAFGELGADVAVSESETGNVASQRVSERAGYAPADSHGRLARWTMTRAAWRADRSRVEEVPRNVSGDELLYMTEGPA